jgi:hypothetical protein
MNTYKTKAGIQVKAVQFSPGTEQCKDGSFHLSDEESFPVIKDNNGNSIIEFLSEIGGKVVVNEGDWIIDSPVGHERCSPALFCYIFDEWVE